jgi:SAM-dependent methyltransferase
MAHPQQVSFLNLVKQKFPNKFKNCNVVDIGSLDINGNTRFLFEDYEYTGVDIGKGPNVDVVSKGHEYKSEKRFDIVISTECFEHDMYYKETLKNCIKLCKAGGMFIFTCASTGRAEHGTARTSVGDAPLLEGEWSNYYKNLTERDIREVLNIEGIFSEFQFYYEENHKDLYFWGIKKTGPKIWTHMIWDEDRNLGKGYNDAINQHPDEDWVAVIDHDAMFTTMDWYTQLQECINSNPNAAAFTSRTNRVACLELLTVGVDPHNHDYSYHRRVGQFLSKKHWGKVSTYPKSKAGNWSGIFIAVNVGRMKEIGGFVDNGKWFGQDQLTHKKIVESQYDFCICNGIYVYHWYKAEKPYEHSEATIKSLEDAHMHFIQLTKC